jgi:hypothetical protein
MYAEFLSDVSAQPGTSMCDPLPCSGTVHRIREKR